jgi:transposase
VESSVSTFFRLGRKRHLVQNVVLFSTGCRYGIHYNRLYHFACARLCYPKKNAQESEGLGRSCGGFSTKIHAVCDALGNPLRFIITAGQKHDSTQAIELIDGLKSEAVLADKGYDASVIVEAIESMGAIAVIPSKNNALIPRMIDTELYKERHKIECLFGFLKHYRRLFARFDKLKTRFSAFLHFAATLQWLK